MSPYSVPTNIEGVLVVLDKFDERLEKLEGVVAEVKRDQQEMKNLVSKIDGKFWKIIATIIVAAGARYGLDLSGIVG